MRTWADMEDAVRSVTRDLLGGRRLAAGGNVVAQDLRELHRYEAVDSGFVDAFDQLRRLRNKVAHGAASPTAVDAVQFATLVGQLITTLRVAATTEGPRVRAEHRARLAQGRKAAVDARDREYDGLTRRISDDARRNGTPPLPPNEPDLTGPARPDER